MINLNGKVAIVTGAGRGIGKEIAIFLAQQGSDIVVADLNQEQNESVVKEIESLGRRALSLEVNVTNKENVDAMFTRTIEELGSVDILVNNAGITRDAMLHKMTEEQFDQVLQVHMKGTFLCMQAAAKHMREKGSGKIVNISSLSGKVGNLGQVNYAGAKAGIIGMTKSAAKELAKFSVNVNAIQPGFIDTEMTQAIPENVREKLISEIPLKRTGKPVDIAKAVAFLSSEFSDYMTGNVLEVTGGKGM